MELDAIMSIFLTRPDVIALYLFGSASKSQATQASDIDIALLCEKPLSPLEVWELAQSVAVAIKKDVDLIDLRQASTVMAFQVISTGERVYCKNAEKADWFEALTLSSYWRLNEERKDIIDEVYKRGSIS